LFSVFTILSSPVKARAENVWIAVSKIKPILKLRRLIRFHCLTIPLYRKLNERPTTKATPSV
jgi:hypothetical protein